MQSKKASRFHLPVILIAGISVIFASSAARGADHDVVISELMYNPAGSQDYEYLELTNRGATAVNIGNWSFASGIQYTFPTGTTLNPGQRIVVTGSPTLIADRYGLGASSVFGPWTGRLDNAGERVTLVDANDGLIVEVDYDDSAPWPTGGDGDGRSIELSDLARNGNVGRFWRPSRDLLGSPAAANSAPAAIPAVVINEFQANSSDLDWIELYNAGSTPVDLTGYFLTDSPDQPTRYRIPSGTLAAGGYRVFDQDELGFALSAGGEAIFLVGPDGAQWIDGYDFGNQPLTDVSEGRYPDGGSAWRKMTSPTPGAANVFTPVPGIVISEIMYHPATGSPGPEYIELTNTGAAPADLTGWRLRDAVSYDFPATILPAGGRLVIAGDPALVMSTYGISGVLGPWTGQLSNYSAEIDLEDSLGNPVNQVEYEQEGLWPESADGGGPSLELIHFGMNNRLPGAWRASTGNGTPGAANSQSVANPAASISRLRHSPLVPTPAQTVTITARAGAGNLTGVTVFYKRDQDAAWSSLPMFDDGAHGDGQPGDDIYGAALPAQAHGTIVEFYVSATATGGNAVFPPSAPARSALYIVQHAEANSNLNIFRFILTDESHSFLMNRDPFADESNVDCTLIADGQAYYNCGIRFRSGSRSGPKYSYKVRMPPARRFRGEDRFNLNFEKADATHLKNKIFYDLLQDMNLPACRTEFIHTRWRNTYAGMHLYTEVHRDAFLERHFGERSGNLYKATAGWTTATAWNEWHGPGGIYEKETNEAANNWSDFAEMGNIMRNQPNASYESEVQRVVDVRNWGQSFAVLAIGCLIDTPWHVHNQNYRLYRRDSDRRFAHILYDFDDAYWQTMYAGTGYFASLFPDTTRFLQRPPFTREMLHGAWKALNTQTGVYRENRIRQKVRYYHGLISGDVQADPYSGTGSRWTDFQNGINRWNNDWLPTRNTLLRNQLPTTVLAITTNGGNDFSTPNANVTLQGTAPIAALDIKVGETVGGITWTAPNTLTPTHWSKNLTLLPGANLIHVIAYDDRGVEFDRRTINIFSGAATATPSPTSLPTPTPTSTPAPTATPTITPTPTPTVCSPVARVAADRSALHHPPAAAAVSAATTLVQLELAAFQSLSQFMVDLRFDPARLQIDSVEYGDILAGAGAQVSTAPPAINNTAGTLLLAAMITSGNPSSLDGVMAEIVFSTRPVAQTTATAITLANVTLSTDGCAAPTTVPASITLCHYADRDCNDQVDIVDLQQVAAKWNTRAGDAGYDPAFDVDFDGDIDIADLQFVAARWGDQAPYAP